MDAFVQSLSMGRRASTEATAIAWTCLVLIEDLPALHADREKCPSPEDEQRILNRETRPTDVLRGDPGPISRTGVASLLGTLDSSREEPSLDWRRGPLCASRPVGQGSDLRRLQTRYPRPPGNPEVTSQNPRAPGL
jgi:hypothetical protein